MKWIITFDECLHLPNRVKDLPSRDEALMWAMAMCDGECLLDDMLADAFYVEEYTPALAQAYELEDQI